MARTAKIATLLGPRECGKTTFLVNLSKGVLDKGQGKVLYFDLVDNPNNPVQVIELSKAHTIDKGCAKCILSDFEDCKDALRKIERTTIIFEDFNRYPQTRIGKDFRRAIIDAKQRGNDCIFVYHFFSQVQPEILKYTDILIMFKSKEDFRTSRAKMGAHLFDLATTEQGKTDWKPFTPKILPLI